MNAGFREREALLRIQGIDNNLCSCIIQLYEGDMHASA